MDVTQERRAMVQAALSMSPHSGAGGNDGLEWGKNKKSSQQHDLSSSSRPDGVTCSLCHCTEASQFKTPGDSSSSLVAAVMITLFGLAFGEEEEMTLCDFCLTQLKNLVSLKKNIDNMTQRLSSMVVSLHAILALPPTRKGHFYHSVEANVETESTKSAKEEAEKLDPQDMEIGVMSQEETCGQKKGDQEQDENGVLTPLENVLKNSDLLQIILGKVKEQGNWRLSKIGHLRLVCRDFNNAVLTMPYPHPIILNLNKMFPDVCEEAEECLNPTPVPLEEIPQLHSNDLCRNVEMELKTYSDYCEHPAIKYAGGDLGDFRDPVSLNTIVFMNFSCLHGSNIRVLKLTDVPEESLPPLAVAINRKCFNLRDLTISMCLCKCEPGAKDVYEFHFSPNKTLKKLELETEWMDFEGENGNCPAVHRMGKAIIEASPELQELNCTNHMSFDLISHRKLTHVSYSVTPAKASFTNMGLMNMMTSIPSLNTLKLSFGNLLSNNGSIPDIQSQISLPAFPTLRNLEFSLLAGNFGNALGEGIFSPCTLRLHSLTIESNYSDSIQHFLLLIRDNFPKYINVTVRQLEIKGRESGISNIAHLSHLKTAFPNLKVLKLTSGVGQRQVANRDDGSVNLRDVFSALSLWKELQELDLTVNFRLTFSALKDVFVSFGQDFWRQGCLRRMKFKVEHFLFPDPRNFYVPETNFEDALLAMKCMESVMFANFVMPATMTQTLLRFISENDLPISFSD